MIIIFSPKIETVDGNVYEGIFRTFSPLLELLVDQAHLVDAQDPGKICEEDVKAMVFNMKDVIRCSAIDTDLDYAIKGWLYFLLSITMQ